MLFVGMFNVIGVWFDEWEFFVVDLVMGDMDFQCCECFVILFLDGVEICGGNFGNVVDGFYSDGIKIFVVGFGVGVIVGVLQVIVNNGVMGFWDWDGFFLGMNLDLKYDDVFVMGDVMIGDDCNDFNVFDKVIGNVIGFNFCFGYDLVMFDLMDLVFFVFNGVVVV